MEIQGRSNICVQLVVGIYKVIGDGKDVQKQPVSDTISIWEDCVRCSHHKEEYYCAVNGELHAAQSCINRRTSTTLTSPPLLVICITPA